MTGYSLTEILYEQNVMPYTALQIADSQARPRLRCRARMRISRVEDDSRLLEARGDGLSGSVMEKLDEEPHGVPRRAKENRRILQDNHHQLIPRLLSSQEPVVRFFSKDCLSFVIPL